MNQRPLRLLLLHGLFGDSANMGALQRSLEKGGYWVESVDLPGHGEGARLDALTVEAMADHVYQSYIATKKIDTVLIGHSLGGKVCMQVAARYPNEVAAIVVLDIAPVCYGRLHDSVFAAIKYAFDMQPINRTALVTYLSQHIDAVALVNFLARSARWHQGQFQWRFDWLGLLQHYDFLRDMPAAPNAANLPALFLKAEFSDYITDAHWSEIRRRFPAAVARVIGGTSHWLHAEKPDLVSATIRRFLER